MQYIIQAITCLYIILLTLTKSKFLVVINLRCRICSRTLQNAYTISDNGNSLTLHYIIIHVGVTSYAHCSSWGSVTLSKQSNEAWHAGMTYKITIPCCVIVPIEEEVRQVQAMCCIHRFCSYGNEWQMVCIYIFNDCHTYSYYQFTLPHGPGTEVTGRRSGL